MRFISRNRPSAAMIVAVVALSLGLGGSAIAANGVLSKAQVKQIAAKQIKKKAPKLSVAKAKTADRATSAATADRATSAQTADRATNVYGANVDADGTMLGSVPGGATSTRVSTGVYRVTFTTPVTGCLVFSALGSNDGSISPGSTGVIPVTGENPNRVAVATFNDAGAVADRDFYVQITCP